MSHRAPLTLWVGLCWIATACATTTNSADDFLRMEEKARNLADQQRWAEALQVSQQSLARCDQTAWCNKDRRFQGAFHDSIGAAEEHMGRRDLALEHYRKAFYSYPLFFAENYFRLLKELGMYRLLRREIDVKLASEETTNRSALPAWTSRGASGCSGRWVAGSYSWRMRGNSGGAGASGGTVVSQSGCVVLADLASPEEQAAGGHLRLRGDIGTGLAILVSGAPCMSTDRGQLSLTKNGFSVNASRAIAMQGCVNGPYVMEFVRN